ncbi:MAG: zinc ribbon domain-containing protein [Gemmatimonadaceae bacterium]
MDDLDRVFHRLVSNIRHRHPEYLTLPFTVQELYETLIPYRHHRRELGIETNQDYEIAVTRLLSGERDYLHADPAMRDKLQAEVKASNMDPGAFREFAGSKVSLAPEALRRIKALTASADGAQNDAPDGAAQASQAPPESADGVEDGPAGSGSQPAVSATFPVSGAPPVLPAPSTPPAPPASQAGIGGSALSSMMQSPVAEGCRFCGGTLPDGRNAVYCPHCGNNLSVSRCPACGSELDSGWKFCATCGRTVG